MPRFEQATYNTETWLRGSRGKSGSYRQESLALIRNMRMLHDGSLVVRPHWFRWGWDNGSESFLNLVGHGQTQFAVIWPHYYRTDVLAGFNRAISIMDATGFKIYRRDLVTNPLTEYYSTTNLNGTTTTAFGFGNVTQLSRYDALVAEVFVRAQKIGAQNGSVSNSSFTLTSTFIEGGKDQIHVGSTIHGGRAFYWGLEYDVASSTSIRDNRIWYSDPYDYTRFSEDTQFIDVDGEVRGAVSIGPNLIIWTVEGNWFVLQGRGDPSRAVLHNKGKNRIPAIDDQPARFSDMAIYNSGDFDVVCIIDRDGNVDTETLSRFGGDTIQGLQTRRSPAASSPLQNAITIPSLELGKAVHLSRGAWVEEDWNLDSGLEVTDRSVLRSHSEENEEFLTRPIDVGGGNYHHALMVRSTVANEPSSWTDMIGFRPVETVDGEIHLPRIWNPDLDVRVVQVTIDCRYWKAASGNTYGTLNLEVEIGDSQSASDHPTVVGPDANMVANLAAGLNQPARLVATPTGGPLQSTSWSEVKLLRIRGFAIEQVMVEYELTGRREH